MKKQLLFIILIFVGFVGAYGQSWISYTQGFQNNDLGGVINDIYITKIPSSADSIYVAIQGVGIKTVNMSGNLSAISSIPTNANSNLRLQVADIFKTGNPDLAVSNKNDDKTDFAFYKNLSSLATTSVADINEFHNFQWKYLVIDTFQYLLATTKVLGTQFCNLYKFNGSTLSLQQRINNENEDASILSTFINAHNNSLTDILTTGKKNESNNNGFSRLHHNNQNSFSVETLNIFGNLTGYADEKIMTGDMDNDGYDDIVVMGTEYYGTGSSNKIVWYKNNNGSFTLQTSTGLPTITDIANSDFVLGDFNYDGKVDICVASGGSLTIYLQGSDATSFTSQQVNTTTLGSGKHRIGLWANKLVGNKIRLDIFVSSGTKLFRFYQGATIITEFTLVKPNNLNVERMIDRSNTDEDLGSTTILGKDITVAWSKVDAAVSYDGFMELKSADGSRKKVLLHKSIPLAIHGNLGNGNIEGRDIGDIKKAKFFIPEDVYTQYAGGTATICVWSVDGAYRRSLDSAVISIIIPPVTQSPDPLPPTDSICPNCPTDPDNPNNVYRRPRVRMVSATSSINTNSSNAGYNMITTTFKSQLTATGWDRPLTNAGFYFSTDSATVADLKFGVPNGTVLPPPTQSPIVLDTINVSAGQLNSLDLEKTVIDHRRILSGTTYFVRAFAVNRAGPVLSIRDSLKKFTTARQQGTIDPPFVPPRDSLPTTEGEDDDGNLDSTHLTGIEIRDVPIFYKRFPQGYPYQTMRDSIKIVVGTGTSHTDTMHPVRLDFVKKDPLGSPDTYEIYILNNRTDTAYNDDRVVLTTKKILPPNHTGLQVPVTPRGYALAIGGDTLTRKLKIFPKYRLQQHFLPNSSTEDGCTVMIRRGITERPSNETHSSSRTDTLNIIVNNSNISLVPNRQKSIALSSWVVSSSYAKIHSAFPTVDTSYLDAVAPSSTRYTFNTVTGAGILGRFNIDNAGNFKFLPKDTTFTISAANDGNDFFKALNDSLYIRIRMSHNIVEFPDPPGGSFDDDTVTVVVPDRNGRDSTVRVTGFPTDGIRVFYQTSDYRLPTETVAVITTTIRNSDSTVRTDTIRRPIQFKRGQAVAAGAKFGMNGLAIRMDSINTGFYHSNPQRIVYKHRDSVWIETTGGTPIIQRRVPLYIIPKQIYDYKVTQNGVPTFVYPPTTTGSDSYNIVGDTINILKRSSATSGTSTMTINFKYNTSEFSQDQLKHLYSPTTNIHQSKTPKLFGTDKGNRISNITPSTADDASNQLAITYVNTTTTGTATDGKVKLTGDSITFFKKTARNLVLRIRKFDSIPNSTLDGILMTGSVLDWCTQSLSDSIHRPTGSTTPTVLKSTTIAGRIVNFEVLPQYRHIIQLKPAVPAVSDNMEARNIKMLDTGQVVIRAYVNDNGDLPALEQLLRFRVVACPAAINNTDIDWIKPGVIDTVFSTLFRDEFELKAIVRQFPQGAVRYEITEGFEDGRILSGNRLKLQGTLGEISIKASYAGSVFYRPSEKLLQVTTAFIKSRQIVKEQPNIPTNFISHSTIRAHSELTVQNFRLKDLIAVRDSITNRDLTTNAKLRATIEPVPINGRVIQGFPRPGDPTINYDTTLFHYEKPVGVPVKLTIWAKEDTLYYESQPYYKNILIIGDTQNPSLILPEYPGKDCFDIKAELKKHYVGEFEYADVMIYNRYGSNVMNLTAKAAEENCLYDVQKLKDGVYLCVLYVDGNRAQPYCSYITIVRSK